MTTHFEFEDAIYEFLNGLRQNHPDWHFAMRGKANKGYERQRFIGAEGRYFGTTFWKIPTDSFTGPAYPIGLYFHLQNDGFGYHLEARQTRKITSERDKALLSIVDSLAADGSEFAERATGRDEKNNNQVVAIEAPQAQYENLDDLLRDLRQDLEVFIPIIDAKLQAAHAATPSFTYRRLTEKDTAKFEKKYSERLAAVQSEESLSKEETAENHAMTGKKSKTSFALNQILYGPPGTGKTYSTINRAVSIVNPAFSNGSENKREDTRKEYLRLVTEGKIVFTTFHQSLSYEDFVEGIKPKILVDDGKTGEVGYDVKPGIFKELIDTVLTANKATSDLQTRQGLLVDKDIIQSANPYKISLGDATDANDNGIYEYCINNDCIALGYGEGVDFTHAKNEKEILSAIKEQRQEEPRSKYEVTAVKVFREWMQVGDLVFIPNGLFSIRAVGVIESDYYFDPEAPIRFSQFRKVKWLYKDIDFPIKEIYGKQFSVQTTYGMFSEPMREGLLRQHDHRPDSNNFVLIIDEINRGNVSAILGELITLLEPNKRLGQPEELTVTLPYSRDTFGVPPNLYIIGTMNTADRSVEALDAALRRRFVFEEIAPNPKVITDIAPNGGRLRVGDKTVDLAELLRLLNARIAALRDNDHQLGHSYFLEIETWENLRDVMVDRIVPLLREYFFANYGQLQLVVGKSFCRASPRSQVKFATLEGGMDTDLDAAYTYTFPRPATPDELIDFLNDLGYPWEGMAADTGHSEVSQTLRGPT